MLGKFRVDVAGPLYYVLDNLKYVLFHFDHNMLQHIFTAYLFSTVRFTAFHLLKTLISVDLKMEAKLISGWKPLHTALIKNPSASIFACRLKKVISWCFLYLMWSSLSSSSLILYLLSTSAETIVTI